MLRWVTWDSVGTQHQHQKCLNFEVRNKIIKTFRIFLRKRTPRVLWFFSRGSDSDTTRVVSMLDPTPVPRYLQPGSRRAACPGAQWPLQIFRTLFSHPLYATGGYRPIIIQGWANSWCSWMVHITWGGGRAARMQNQEQTFRWLEANVTWWYHWYVQFLLGWVGCVSLARFRCKITASMTWNKKWLSSSDHVFSIVWISPVYSLSGKG